MCHKLVVSHFIIAGIVMFVVESRKKFTSDLKIESLPMNVSMSDN